MDILKKGRTAIGQKMNNNMIQYSVFAGIVFIIIAHPQTFKLVDSVIKVHNKNILLLVHAVVVSLIMYFGSLYLFIPAQKVLLEGVKNKSVWGDMKQNMKQNTSEIAKKAVEKAKSGAKKYAEEKGLPTGFPSGGTDHADVVSDAVAETDTNVSKKNEFGEYTREEIEEQHEDFKAMSIGTAVECLNDKGITGGLLDKANLGEIFQKCVRKDE